MPLNLINAHCLDALPEVPELDLIATDPPYAFGGSGDEHALSATVAVALREYAQKLRRGRWMLVMCASSWRSTSYMVEAVRGVVEPVRIAHWNKPVARTKASTSGWRWASVHVIALRKGKAADASPSPHLDHITAAPLTVGRRAELPPAVATWMVEPFAVAGGTMCDPFCGSGALVRAAAAAGMDAIGIEKNPVDARAA
jgi:tRNA G10  N-methylase Trm11